MKECPAKAFMLPYHCENAVQCFEPCGDLGHDERYVTVAPNISALEEICPKFIQSVKTYIGSGEDACAETHKKMKQQQC